LFFLSQYLTLFWFLIFFLLIFFSPITPLPFSSHSHHYIFYITRVDFIVFSLS
jgi:hypothetical protein